MSSPQAVPNNLVWAILATLFCCLPIGIVAIVYATQVDTKLAAGDVAGAQQSARLALRWCMVSAVIPFIALALYFLAVFAIFAIAAISGGMQA
jgi:hypothetical protein